MTTRTRVFLPLLFLLLGTLAGCERPETAWQEAQETDTITAYEDFLDRHPEAPQAAEAERRIAAIRRTQSWQAATEEDTADAYERFLAEFPEGAEAEQARERLAEITREQEWAALRDTTDIDALRAFAEQHRDHDVGARARERAEALEQARLEEERRRAEEERRRAEEEARRTHRVQLAALRSEARARESADLLEQQLADALGDLELEVAPSGAFYVVLTTPVPEEDARSVCARIREQDGDCLVVAR